MQWSFHLIYPMLPTAFSGPGNYSKPLRSREWQAVPKAITARKVTTAQSTLTNYNGLFFLLFLTTTSGGCADIISISGMKKSSEKWLSRDSRSPVHAGGWRTPVRCRNLYKDVLYNLRSNLVLRNLNKVFHVPVSPHFTHRSRAVLAVVAYFESQHSEREKQAYLCGIWGGPHLQGFFRPAIA